MQSIMIKDGKIISKSFFGRTDVFEIVNEFPGGYVVWNIGRHNFPYEGYIPLAKPTEVPYNIDLRTLKALKLEDNLSNSIISAAHRQEINSLNFEEIVSSLSRMYVKG